MHILINCLTIAKHLYPCKRKKRKTLVNYVNFFNIYISAISLQQGFLQVFHFYLDVIEGTYVFQLGKQHSAFNQNSVAIRVRLASETRPDRLMCFCNEDQ